MCKEVNSFNLRNKNIILDGLKNILLSEWTFIIFSDKKNFNLYGPDGSQYYWHCLKQKEQNYSTLQKGGGSLMVWFAVDFGGRSRLVFI